MFKISTRFKKNLKLNFIETLRQFFYIFLTTQIQLAKSLLQLKLRLKMITVIDGIDLEFISLTTK